QCAACHFASSTAKKIGPGMKGIYRKGKFADGRAVSDANMISWIRNGGKNMPPLASNLNADEIRQVIAYLHTL
ncbi:MAG TPA: cytochrome c, partial [Candidatus Acidoferrales bacterium]|nr:cytochrome c [Candidatus Acidoferrales bacterium]